MNPLRVAIVVNRFPVLSQTFIARHAAMLLERGHAVRLFSDREPRPDPEADAAAAASGLLPHTTYLGGADLLAARPPQGAGARVRDWLGALPNAARIGIRAPRVVTAALGGFRGEEGTVETFRRAGGLWPWREQFDVAHVHFGPTAKAFRFIPELWGRPLVASFHGYDYATYPVDHGPAVYRELWGAAAAITVGSDYAAGKVAALGCPVDRIVVTPAGVDVGATPHRPRTRRADGVVELATVARLVPTKGVHLVLAAVAEVRRSETVDLRLTVVGDGPQRAELERQAAALGLTGAVVFRGPLDPAAAGRVLDGADLFVLASYDGPAGGEGQGLVLQEAQARGLPVLATDCGGMAEGVVDGVTGRVVAAGAAAPLADGLRWLLDRAGAWPEMGRAGRDFVASRFDFPVLAERYEELYTAVIRGGRLPAPS